MLRIIDTIATYMVALLIALFIAVVFIAAMHTLGFGG